MKRYLVLFLVLMTAGHAFADNTVISDEFTSIGFWGGPKIGLTMIDGQFGMLVGSEWLVTVNRNLALGGTGWNLVTNVDTRDAIEDYSHLKLYYGGFVIRYIAGTENATHMTAGLMLGGGSFSFRNEIFGSDDQDYKRSDALYIVEPNVSLELNITRFFRVNLLGSYRLALDVDFEPYEMKDISGPTMGMFFKFGYDFQKSDLEKIEELWEE